MVAKTLLSLVGSSELPKFAPDLNFPKDKTDTVAWFNVTGIDASAGLTTILSLTGKFAINNLFMQSLLANNIATVKLTVDGVVIWNVDPVTNGVSESYIGAENLQASSAYLEPMMCETSFLFEMQMDSDTSIELRYAVRAIK